MAKTISIGALNRYVELFQYTSTNSSTSEARPTESSLGSFYMSRHDTPADEAEAGRLIPLGVVRFIARYKESWLAGGTKYFIRDVDGDWDVNSVSLLPTHQRNRYLELKCSKRG